MKFSLANLGPVISRQRMGRSTAYATLISDIQKNEEKQPISTGTFQMVQLQII